MTTHVYALFEDEKDYKDAYSEAEQEGLLADSENLKTLRNVEDEDDIPFAGTSMSVEVAGYAIGGLLVGLLVGYFLARLPALSSLPKFSIILLASLGFTFFGFLAGIFTGASRTESHRQQLWRSFQPGNLAVLLDMRHKETAERMASIFSRHHARLVEVV
jgi:F0F1-type ATP synthase assembly protein I